MIDIDITEEALGNNPTARSAIFDDCELTELEEIQSIRRDLTKILITDETGKRCVPGKSAEKILLAQLLDGSERLIMTKARLKIASKTTDELGNLADAVAKSLRGFKAGSKPALPFEKEIPAEYLRIDDVPGEMEIGNLPMTIEDISK